MKGEIRIRARPAPRHENWIHDMHNYSGPQPKPKYQTVRCDDCGRGVRERLGDPPTKRICGRCYRKSQKRWDKKHEVRRRRERRMTLGVGERMLTTVERVWKTSARFDTAVRDTVAEGLAYIVHAAYDAIACGKNIASKHFHNFIADSTREWFLKRGFVEWFANGAATLFHSTHWPGTWHRLRWRQCKQKRRKHAHRSR